MQVYRTSFSNMAEIDKWLIFSILDQKFIASIKIACVFGSSGNEALIVNKDDDVYALGYKPRCRGFRDAQKNLGLRKVVRLCKKGVIKFSYGSGPHVLAITQDGELYSWGHNSSCQLGNGTTYRGFSPERISSKYIGKKVIDVACGSYHSLALTADGEVYAWGRNNWGQVGLGTTTNQPTPRKVTAGIGSRGCVCIACGRDHSIAVLDNGEVYGWGYNGKGQLGIGSNANQSYPYRVANLQGTVIQKVACGYAHTMALSDEGILYAWGDNYYGQLGTGNKDNQLLPVRIASEIGRIIELAASYYNDISAALTEKSKVYMWGKCRGQAVTNLTETPFHSLHGVFACFASPAVTWSPMDLGKENVSTVCVTPDIEQSPKVNTSKCIALSAQSLV